MIMNNTFRKALDDGKPTIGTHFLFSDPDVAELIGDTELFDYAEFSAEYSAFDMRLLYHLARAAQCSNLPLMIKLDEEGQGFWAQAALGAGFKAILFTDIRRPDDIDTCYKIIKPDDPKVGGRMGLKLRRPALSAYEPESYLKDLNSIVFCMMLEKQIAVENIDKILMRAQERSVDMIQWGPADYSITRGRPHMMFEADIMPIEELVIGKCLEYGVAPRIEIGDVDQAKRYIDMGVRHFCIGWDRFILQVGLKNIGEGLRKLTDSI